jgi:hypothetical protein
LDGDLPHDLSKLTLTLLEPEVEVRGDKHPAEDGEVQQEVCTATDIENAGNLSGHLREEYRDGANCEEHRNDQELTAR